MEMSASDIIATVALGFSAFVWFRQRKINQLARRLNELQIESELAAREDAQKAELGARFVKHGQHSYQLNIYNRGPADARNVSIHVLGEENFLASSELRDKLPVDCLFPQESVKLLALPTLGSGAGLHIDLTWNDGTGHRSREMTVHL